LLSFIAGKRPLSGNLSSQISDIFYRDPSQQTFFIATHREALQISTEREKQPYICFSFIADKRSLSGNLDHKSHIYFSLRPIAKPSKFTGGGK